MENITKGSKNFFKKTIFDLDINFLSRLRGKYSFAKCSRLEYLRRWKNSSSGPFNTAVGFGKFLIAFFTNLQCSSKVWSQLIITVFGLTLLGQNKQPNALGYFSESSQSDTSTSLASCTK